MFTIHHADNLTVLPTIPNGSVDTLITDPPYGIVNKFGVAKGDRGSRRLEFEWDKPDGVAQAVAQAVAKLKPTASVFVFLSVDIVGEIMPVLRAANFTVKPAAWTKKCPAPAGKGNWWPSAFELAVYGYRGSPYFGDERKERNNVFCFDSYRFGQPGKVDHPTQKPLALMELLVNALVPPGGCCLDPFMGSGSTGVACAGLGRDFIGIEKDEKYFNIAKRRLEGVTPELALTV